MIYKVGLQLDNVIVTKLVINENDKTFHFNVNREVPFNSVITVEKCLYFKDKTSMSDKNYYIFR